MPVNDSVELFAGHKPSGEQVIEKIRVSPTQQANCYQLLQSPVFVRGIARADVIQKLDVPRGAFKIIRRSGNLCIRVFGKQELAAIEQSLTPQLEKLGGNLDICEPNVLVYSIHVSCGFQAVEKLLDDALQDTVHVIWNYGNVYDPDSAEPLNWWQSMLSAD